ncbi:SURF1 family domain protein [Burkholderia mallei]|nr:SURF1 family domain protein [Burkholderia mallei]
MPVEWIQPIQFANRMNRNREIDSPTRIASDQTIRFVWPRSCIMKYSADTMLAMMSTKAIGTRMCMKLTGNRQLEEERVIIALRSGDRRARGAAR